MKTLAIETSGRSFGAALSENGRILREIFDNSGFIHSATLIPRIAKLLKSAGWSLRDIDKIAVSTGPGSFTGIRVGLTCARIFGQALDIPVACVDTLELLKAAVPEGDYAVVAAIDAGRGEVYVKNKKIEIIEARKYFSGLKDLKGGIVVAGNAALAYGDTIAAVLRGRLVKHAGKYVFPMAGVLAVMAEKIRGGGFSDAKPLYVRKSWAEEKNSNK